MNSPADIKPRQLRSLVLLLVLLPFVPAIINFRFMAEAVRQEREAVRERFTALYASHLEAAAGLFEKQMQADAEGLPVDASEEELHKELQVRRMDGVLISRDGQNFRSTGRLELSGVIEQDILTDWPTGIWHPVPDRTGEYVYRIQEENVSIWYLRTTVTLGREASTFFQSAFGVEPEVVVSSPAGRRFPHTSVLPATTEQIYLTKILAGSLPGWKVSLITSSTSMLAGTLSEQVAAYQRIGIILVAVILAISTLAGFAVTRQMRFNEMHLTGIAAIAHELKTPLASMRLLLDTLSSGRLKTQQEQTEYVELARGENTRLSRVVEGLLTLGRMQSRNYKPRLRPVRAADFVEAAVQTVGLRLRELGFNLERTDAMPGQIVMAEPEAMTTAIVNLLENAIKYSGERKEIRIHSSVEKGWWRVQVCDSGIGMPRREVRRIFQPFYQVDSKLSRSTEGAGLGLSIVQRIVKSHAGKITAESEPGEGSIFTIQLPAVG